MIEIPIVLRNLIRIAHKRNRHRARAMTPINRLERGRLAHRVPARLPAIQLAAGVGRDAAADLALVGAVAAGEAPRRHVAVGVGAREDAGDVLPREQAARVAAVDVRVDLLVAGAGRGAVYAALDDHVGEGGRGCDEEEEREEGGVPVVGLSVGCVLLFEDLEQAGVLDGEFCMLETEQIGKRSRPIHVVQ